MKKVYVLVTALVVSNGLYGAGSVAGDIEAVFTQTLNDTQARLKQILTIFSNVNKYCADVHYQETKTIKMLEPDVIDPSKKVGIIIDLGDAGHGSLNAYDGMIIDIQIDALPDEMKAFILTLVKRTIAPVIKGTVTTDAQGSSVLRSSPALEFMLKMMLLGRDYANNVIDSKAMSAETLLSVFRLAQVPGIKNMSDVFKQVPGPWTAITKGIKIGKTSLNDYLNIMWKKVFGIMNYDFTTVEPSVLGNKDIPQIIAIVLAIVMRFNVDYLKAKEAFVATPEGKAAEEKSKSTKNTSAFNDALPGYKQIRSDAMSRTFALCKRLPVYRTAKRKLLTMLAPLVDPFLKDMGLTLDDIFPYEDKVPQPEIDDETRLKMEQQIEAASADDVPLDLGDVDSATTMAPGATGVDTATPSSPAAQSAAAVAEEPVVVPAQKETALVIKKKPGAGSTQASKKVQGSKPSTKKVAKKKPAV